MIKKLSALLCVAGMFIVSGLTVANAQGRACDPTEVAVFSNRIHVKCAPIKGKAYTKDIPYYAMNIKDNAMKVNGVLQVMTAAKANGRKLYIWTDMSDYKSVPGCKGNNCRRLKAAAIR